MQALAAAGNRGQMVVAYDRCAYLLREQLGVAPAVETDRLYQQLTGADPPRRSVDGVSGIP
jgi:DNA-binding SARP family transcriptional activator